MEGLLVDILCIIFYHKNYFYGIVGERKTPAIGGAL